MQYWRMIWLLVLELVIFHPSFIQADCIVIRDGPYATGYDYRVECTLTALQIGDSLTDYISGDYANEATKAQSIIFKSSTIHTVPVGVFRAFSAIKYLDMGNIGINRISPGGLSGLTNLQTLDRSCQQQHH